MGKLEELQAKHPAITYQTAKFELTPAGLEMKFEFELENGPTFHPSNLILGVTQTQLDRLDQAVIQELVFNIGLVELLSYWKTTCSPLIKIQAGQLNPGLLVFWQNLLVKGMGEYFFVNQIDFTRSDFVRWELGQPENKHELSPLLDSSNFTIPTPSDDPSQDHPQSYLIPVGGGKDSVVSIELLKRFSQTQPDLKLATLVLNPTPAARQVVQISQLPVLEIERRLDPQLLDLNRQGYLNGHTPFSALLAFLSTLTAYIFNYQAVALSNEQSANEESLHFLSHAINHQYSKSFEFETAFQKYIANLMTDYSFRTRRNQAGGAPDLSRRTFDFPSPQTVSINVGGLDRKVMKATLSGRRVISDKDGATLPFYFSILRPLTELKIAQVLAHLTQDKPEYLTTFVSCNKGGRESKWCGDCAKCLFAYIILAPFLGLDLVKNIFGRDLLSDSNLEPILTALIGQTDQKPLDCVGLKDESRTALYLIWQKYQKTGATLPLLVHRFETTLTTDPTLPTLADQLLNTWYQPDAIPRDLARWFKTQVEELKYVS